MLPTRQHAWRMGSPSEQTLTAPGRRCGFCLCLAIPRTHTGLRAGLWPPLRQHPWGSGTSASYMVLKQSSGIQWCNGNIWLRSNGGINCQTHRGGSRPSRSRTPAGGQSVEERRTTRSESGRCALTAHHARAHVNVNVPYLAHVCVSQINLSPTPVYLYINLSEDKNKYALQFHTGKHASSIKRNLPKSWVIHYMVFVACSYKVGYVSSQAVPTLSLPTSQIHTAGACRYLTSTSHNPPHPARIQADTPKP